MKSKILIACFLIIGAMQLYAQDYYWYGSKKVPLYQSEKQFVLIRKSDTSVKRQTNTDWRDAKTYISEAKEQLQFGIVDPEDMVKIKMSSIVYSIPAYKTDSNAQEIYLSHLFSVKLKKNDDYELLRRFAQKNDVSIEYNEYLPLWYVMSCLNSDKNALEMANLFYESGLFAVSEPVFWGETNITCTNDTYFSSQWNLKNTGQYGENYSNIDIHYCDTRSRVLSNGVIIAVVDHGIQLDHPDLSENISSISYDSETNTSPSQVYGSHGTACAGIIGAVLNNNLGIAGIASNCKLMSISNYMGVNNYASAINRAKGIDFAVNHNAAVISNSWYSGIQHSDIDDAISNALRYGRNGKGCVVVFSSGNNNDSVLYPANSNDSIIVVGAISPCGERKSSTSCDGQTNWGSNYGTQLDIVAPGVHIPTTDITGVNGLSQGDYYLDFWGTSAACPHVAAVAGLILSVNPYLTQKEVADIIESTAQKVGPYTYSTTSGRLNGTWNNEMGYGLVDAYTAVLEAKNRHPIQEADYICDTTCFYLTDAPNNATFTWTIQQSIAVQGSYDIIQGQGTSSVCVEHYVPTPFPFTSISDSSTSYSMEERDLLFPPVYIYSSISVTVTTQDTTYTITKMLRNPIGNTPEVSASDSSYIWPIRDRRSFTVSNCTTEPDSVFYWEMRRENNTEYTHVGRTFSHKPASIGHYTVSVTNTEQDCGDKTTTYSFYVTRSLPHLIVTNYQGVLDVSILEEEPKSEPSLLRENADYTIELWHNIYGLMKECRMQSLHEQIDINSLPQGVYVILLKENGNIITQEKIQF